MNRLYANSLGPGSGVVGFGLFLGFRGQGSGFKVRVVCEFTVRASA